MNNYQFSVSPSEFSSQGLKCRADLYLPLGIEKPAVVIMAHGFGAERNFVLPNFAEYFAKNGLAVYLFDYRCFGDSDGLPRNYVNPYHHLQDWQAALAHVKTLTNINNKKIALWGSSYSGGHVIVTAAKNSDVKAIVSQVPHVNSLATAKLLGISYLIKATWHGLLDLFSTLLGRDPHYVKIYSSPSEFAVLNTIDSIKYGEIVSKNSAWQNRCPARIMLIFATYNPIKFAKKVTCPALIMSAEKDSLIPASAVAKTADNMPNATLIKYPFGHFDIYHGEHFLDAVNKQCNFLLQNLK